MSFELAFFRANKGNGNAAVLNSREATADNEAVIFLNMFPEKPEGEKFDSYAGIKAKLGQPDVGEMLAVLTGRKDGCGQLKEGKWSGLYHQAENYFTTIRLVREEGGSVTLGVYRKNKEGKTGSFNMKLTMGDEVLLTEFLRNSLREMLTKAPWNGERKSNDENAQAPASQPAPAPQPAKAPPTPPQEPAPAKRQYVRKNAEKPATAPETAPVGAAEDIPF